MFCHAKTDPDFCLEKLVLDPNSASTTNKAPWSCCVWGGRGGECTPEFTGGICLQVGG